MTDNIIETLGALGFSKMETLVYCALVPEEKMGGYQLAKKLNAPRPSVYSALENLLSKEYIKSIPGEIAEYQAVPPDILIDGILKKQSSNAAKAKEMLKTLAAPISIQERFVNIEGKTKLISIVNNLISEAKKEIVFNCSMPLDFFKDELLSAAKRKVRIVLFSWQNLDTLSIPLEFFCGYDGTDCCPEQRILLVSDMAHCVVGSNDRAIFFPHRPHHKIKKLPDGENDFLGMTSDNRLIVNLVSEHIHFDIYLQRLRKKFKRDIITKDIRIGTLMEKGI
ncbi:TrmB family transcriptional regulator [Treponema sp.]|uniref:TrmB family transcriptional regulator n=1 Tax=Treponema sp. TaxID=166 RepID=UPI003F116EDF